MLLTVEVPPLRDNDTSFLFAGDVGWATHAVQAPLRVKPFLKHNRSISLAPPQLDGIHLFIEWPIAH